MRIKQIWIRSFRGIKDAEVILDPKLTVLVGANNAGKTTVLDALAAVVTYRRGTPIFLDTDFRAVSTGADVREAQPIAITLTLVPSADNPRFEAGELGQLRAQPSVDGTEHLRLRLTAQYSVETGRIETRLVDLDPKDGEINVDGHSVFPFRELLPFRAFGAERDLRRGMGGRWSDWSLVLNEVRPTPDVLRRAAEHFVLGSEVLIENTKDLAEIADALRPAGEAVGLPGSDVKLSAAPQDPAELLQQVMVEMRLPGAPRGFSADRHGLGTQGALLFAVYRLQVERLRLRAGPGASAVLTVEEPEAHLHPTAQRAMATQIRELPGQVVVASHSPDFVGRATGRIAVLRSVRGETSIREIDTSERSFRDHPRVVFARSILLTEGRDAHLLPHFARALRIDLDGLGVEVVDVQGQGSLKPAWEVFGPRGLGMPVILMGDADDLSTMRAFLRSAGEAPPKDLAKCVSMLRRWDYFTCWPVKCLEFELAEIDSGRWVDQAFLDQGEPSLADWIQHHGKDKINDTWKGKLGNRFQYVADLKPEPALARAYRLSKNKAEIPPRVAALMTKDGTDATLIPSRFRDALERAAKLARE